MLSLFTFLKEKVEVSFSHRHSFDSSGCLVCHIVVFVRAQPLGAVFVPSVTSVPLIGSYKEITKIHYI